MRKIKNRTIMNPFFLDRAYKLDRHMGTEKDIDLVDVTTALAVRQVLSVISGPSGAMPLESQSKALRLLRKVVPAAENGHADLILATEDHEWLVEQTKKAADKLGILASVYLEAFRDIDPSFRDGTMGESDSGEDAEKEVLALGPWRPALVTT